MFITAFTSAATCPYPEPDQPSPHPLPPTSWRSILILSSIITWFSQAVSFPQVSPSKPCICLSSPPYVLHVPPTSFFLILSPEQFGEEYRSLSSSLCSFLFSSVTSSLFGPNILLNTLFANTFSLPSSLNVSDQVSHPYKMTGLTLDQMHEMLIHIDEGGNRKQENSFQRMSYRWLWSLSCTTVQVCKFMRFLSHGQTLTFNGAASISEITARVFYTPHYEAIWRDRVYWLANSLQG